MHVHRSCGGSPVSMSTIYDAMTAQNLSVVSLLADMGNGEVQDPLTDLPKVNGQDDPNAPPGRIVRWDAEWHWDATYYQFAHQALGGHIVALGLTNAYQIWDESTVTIFDWARAQGGVSGFAHMQYLGDEFPTTLNCCIPIEYPVEVALGSCDFISQDVAGSDSAMRAYYRLLNCGFRPGFAAGSDYPCEATIGGVLTYVQVDGSLTYRKWIDGIAAGRTVVSRNGHREFLDLKVNGTNSPGDEIQLPASGSIPVTVQWTASQNYSGTIELVRNGVVVASQAASVSAGTPFTWNTSVAFTNSGWLVARRLGAGGHQSHTAALFVLVNGAPIRASATDALFYVNWMDELLTRTAVGGVWESYFTTNRALAHSRYQAAREIFQQIAFEAGADDLPPSTGDYRSAGSGNWDTLSTWQRWNGSTWAEPTVGQRPTSSSGAITIRNGHTVTVAANVTVDQVFVAAGGQITVGAATLTVANGAGTDLVVYGTVATTTSTSAAININSGATIAFNSGATYRHGRNSGTVPTATWNPNSTCEIAGMTSTHPGGMGQTFGHVIFNSNMENNATATVMSANLTTVGNLTIATTGTRPLEGSASSTSRTISVGGDFIFESGNFTLKNGSGTGVINVAGSYSQTGGTFTLRATSTSNPATLNVTNIFSMSGGTLNMSAVGAVGTLNLSGSFTHTGGTITESSSSSGAINFIGTAPQTYTGGGTMSQTINFTVANGATLLMGTSLVGNGSIGTFTLASGGTLGIGDAQGITTSGTSGNVRVTGTRTYNNAANYIYNGTSPQVPGNGLTTANNLTIANVAGVTINTTHTVNGVCTVQSGAMLLGTGTINGPIVFDGTVAPGGAVGTLTTGAETWSGGGTYRWELNNATGAAGTGYDRLNAGGNSITIAATSENKFTLQLVTLNGAAPGLAANFDPNNSYTWTIASGGSVSGFAPEEFAIDASAFQNDLGVGVFSVEQVGGNLLLKFTSELIVTTTNLPGAVTNIAYSATLTASGGPPPYTWSIIDGSLPPGLSLNAGSGAITGVPTAAGVYAFVAQVADATLQTTNKPLSITIALPAPILVLTNTANPFTAYYSEILLTEGLNSFALGDIAAVSEAMLSPYDVIVLGEMVLTTPQVETLSNWVYAGGKLIAMRPDKQLAGLLGLTDANSTLAEAYLSVNTSSGPGVGIVSETMQFHGVADRYTLAGASSVATLYSNPSTPTANPAVTLLSVGANGGQAAAFTYDLARSVVYTRQGNPAWEGQERNGDSALRSVDLFFGNASGDPQPDWVDFDKIAIPQADEQQRLLANLIIQMNADRKLLPRFWYFPDGNKAAIVMTGDDHARNGTTAHFDQFIALSGTNALVDDWKTIRSTSYIFPDTVNANPPLTDAQAAAYVAAGFEISLHCDGNCTTYTANQLNVFFQTQLQQFAINYPSVPPPTTHRMHCIAWSGYTILPEVGLLHGIRLDTSYYYWPAAWVQNRPGLFTGSGMAMRFATTNGNMIDVYQAATQLTDESGQSYPFTSDVLMDRALGPEGYYGFFVANMHTDPDTDIPGRVSLVWANAIIASALERGVPVISARQLLTWLDARNRSSIQPINSTINSEVFSVVADAAARGLQVLVPVRPGYNVSSVSVNGGGIEHATVVVKGVQYVVVPALNGHYQIDYILDTTPPSITSVLPEAGATGVALSPRISVGFSEAMAAPTINSDTIQLRNSSNVVVAATVAYHPSTFTADLLPAGILALTENYTVTVKGGSGGVTDLAGLSVAEDFVWSFGTMNQLPFSLWDDSAVPVVTHASDTNAIELGMKFRSAVAGQILGIRFFKGPNNTGPHVGNLWSSNGTLLASVTFNNETALGWQSQAFATPVAIQSNTTYVVSYHAPSGSYSEDEGFFAGGGLTNFPLHALANGEDGANGVYRYGPSAFPTNFFNSENYWVDVVFSGNFGTDTKAPLVSSVLPAPDATVGAGSTMTVKFDEPMSVSSVNTSTIQLRDSSNALVPATVSYNAATFRATLTPNASLGAGTMYTVTVKGGAGGVTDLAGNPLFSDYAWSFSTFAQPPAGIWTDSAVPAIPADADTNATEVGLRFRSALAGYVTGIRFYKGSGNVGPHIGNLWTSSGTLLASVAFANETASGWQHQALAEPVPISPNTTYVVSYHAPAGRYSKNEGMFTTSGVTNHPLWALRNGEDGLNGVYSYGPSGFPTDTFNATHYWVDVSFSQDSGPDVFPPIVSSVTPPAGGNASGIGSTIKATFNEQMKVSTINPSTFTLRDALDNPVPATVWYDPATFTATLVPDNLLTLSATYTATVKGSSTGVADTATNYLANDFTWSFTVGTTTSGTIGNTTDGSETDYIWFEGAWINANRFQANNNWTITNIFAKVGAISGNYKCAVYAEVGGQPGQLLRATIEVSNPTTGWHTFPLASALSLTNGQFYWLAIWSDDANAEVYHSGNTGTLRYGQYNYGNWPDPLATTDGGTFNYSIYASGYLAPALASIAVTPASATIANGATQQFTTTGRFTDGSSQNLSSQVTWNSSDTAVATINSAGLATGVSGGTTTISASLNGIPGFATLNVESMTSTTTSLATSGTPSSYGDVVTFTATVTPDTATGTVNFYDGVTLLGTSPLTGATTKTAVYITAATELAAGTHSLTAVYSGDSTHAGSSSPALAQLVDARPVQLSGTRVYDGTRLIAADDLTIVNNLDGANLTLAGTGLLSAADAGSQTLAAPGTPVRVNSATGSSGDDQVTSFDLTVPVATGGNTLIAVISTRGASEDRVTGITQTGAVWTRAAQSVNADGTTAEIWYAPNVSGAATGITVNLATSLRAAAVVLEYSGVLSADPVDQTAGNTGSGNTATTGATAMTTQPNELWVGGVGLVSSSISLSSPQNSFTAVAAAASTSGLAENNARVYALERIVTEIGTASSGGVVSSSSHWSGTMAAFKAALPSGNPLTLTDSAAVNYTLVGLVGSVEITAKPITVTADAGQVKVFGAVEPALTYTPSETVTFSGALARAEGENVGVYAITQGNLSAGGNYSITFVSADFAITAKPITVAADAGQGKVYGAVDPALTYTPSEAVTFNGALARAAGEDVGNYAINQDTLSAGANYSITFVPADFAITPAVLAVTADDKSKVYDGAVFSGFTSTITGFVNGDDENVVTGSVSYGGTATTAMNVGSYLITPVLTELNAANYTITPVNGNLTIVAVPMLVSISESSEGSGNFILTWRGHPGRTYRLQFKSSITMPAWTDLFPEALADPESGTVQFLHNANSDSQGIYRLLDVTP
ncbi:MAG: DUF4082 domain-containing protein [Verrucomicrobia bacterium]|nr:DUF4082 domain-containing protein [Verrucomicrobiota bacterium]